MRSQGNKRMPKKRGRGHLESKVNRKPRERATTQIRKPLEPPDKEEVPALGNLKRESEDREAIRLLHFNEEVDGL